MFSPHKPLGVIPVNDFSTVTLASRREKLVINYDVFHFIEEFTKAIVHNHFEMEDDKVLAIHFNGYRMFTNAEGKPTMVLNELIYNEDFLFGAVTSYIFQDTPKSVIMSFICCIANLRQENIHKLGIFKFFEHDFNGDIPKAINIRNAFEEKFIIIQEKHSILNRFGDFRYHWTFLNA